VLVQVLRLGESLSFEGALTVESLAYSALLGGDEFRRWRGATPGAAVGGGPDELVQIAREGDHVTLTLTDPDRHNAMTAAMRDALYAALANMLDDPTAPHVSLRGAGKCFSTGGFVAEFGSANDLAAAHLIRTLHSCTRAIAALGARVDVHFHGACVGSGLEVPAAAARRTASANAWFQLPELRMGLIPGAGGTASVARAIGRHRTAWMVLSGQRMAARQALDWGLIHAITEAP
jgi:enoyl-CoA hydratase/carnithine racemase